MLSLWRLDILSPSRTLVAQHSTTVEKLMRLNKMFHQNDIHALAQIKIPAARHGALFADPEAFQSEEPEGTATHTTARPR
jgi:hypothetical protein